MVMEVVVANRTSLAKKRMLMMMFHSRVVDDVVVLASCY
jgi:hypothetical protein